MKRFDVTLLFSQGGCYGCQFYAQSRVAAKAQAIRWARDCGFVGAIKKTEVIEIAIETAGDIEIAKAGSVSTVTG